MYFVFVVRLSGSFVTSGVNFLLKMTYLYSKTTDCHINVYHVSQVSVHSGNNYIESTYYLKINNEQST